MIPHPLCLLRGWWWSFRYAAPISGHDFIEVSAGPNEQALMCKTCGCKSVAQYGRR
jgi:hypothetical protein